MADYRLYLLTAADRIDRAIVLTCEDDDQARSEMAHHTVGAAGAELWLLDRLVHRVEPRSKAGLTHPRQRHNVQNN